MATGTRMNTVGDSMIDWDLDLDLDDKVKISLTSWLLFWIATISVSMVGCCCITSLAGMLGGY